MLRKSLTSDTSTIAGRCRARIRLAAALARSCDEAKLFTQCRKLHLRQPATAAAAAFALAFAALPEFEPVRVPSRTRRAAR
jgi:hypothetical protein